MSRRYIDSEGMNIARGLVPNASHINKFGHNDNIGTSYETVWSVGGLYVYPSNANTVVLTSGDADDTVGGTGARVVEVQGLDENYENATVTVPMNGTGNASNTDVSFIRVFRMRVTRAGSQGINDGDITATIGGTTVSQIDAEEGQTLQANYTVPAGKTGYISDMHVSTGKENKAGLFKLVVRPFENGFNNKQLLETYRNSIVINFPVPLRVEEKSDIEVQAKNLNTGNFSGTATFNITLIDN